VILVGELAVDEAVSGADEAGLAAVSLAEEVIEGAEA
jgi:hypothetical protein